MDEDIKRIIRNSYNNSVGLRDRKEIESWKEKELNKVLANIDDKKNCRLLDLGAGSGLYGKYFENNGLQVTCIDLSSSMINLCKQKGLDAHIMDFYDLEFDENFFNIIWSLNTLLHVPKKSIHKVFEEIKRVLKPNGLFYLGLYGSNNFEGIWEQDRYEPKRFFSFYENNTIKELIQEHFKIEKFEVYDIGDRHIKFQSILAKKI
jgi:SAM-dependent methyltransferase